MESYSEEFKDGLVAKICLSRNGSITSACREAGVPVSTVYGWLRKRGKLKSMAKNESGREIGSEEKLRIVLETHGLCEEALGAYLRKSGLHSSDLEEWKREFLQERSTRGRGRPKKDPELYALRKQNKELEREVRRKDKALAETTALLVLKKKAALIWGESEDDE